MTNPAPLADAEKTYRGWPRGEIFRLVANPSTWLQLGAGETMPVVIESEEASRVVWSSLWPVSPSDQIEITLRGLGEVRGVRVDGVDTVLRFQWFTTQPPDDRGVGLVRHRLNYIFGSVIRGLLVTERPPR